VTSEAAPAVPVSLTLAQWRVVFNALADVPFRHSAPIIEALQRQLSAPPDPAK
jgi:hypothetical protein